MQIPLNISKRIKEIDNPLTRRRYFVCFQLPQTLQDLIFGVETANKIHDIGQKNNLNSDQIWWASHTVGMILLGETNIVDFVKTLKEKCNLAEEPARQLARDLNRELFLAVKESLKKIHNTPEWPREDENNQQQENHDQTLPPTPDLNGNVVDLKNGQ